MEEALTPSTVPQPPEPPEIKRRLQLNATQLIGIPLLALMPLLALLGVFGLAQGEARSEQGSLALRVSYPERTRYSMTQPLVIEVRNIGTVSLDTVVVRLDTDYLSAFSQVELTPTPTRVTAEVYEVTLSDIQPGETRIVSTDVQAHAYWRQRGSISATPGGGEATGVMVSTFVFP
jgi:hypothetical protein